MLVPTLDIQALDLQQLNALYEYQNVMTRIQRNLTLLGNSDNSTMIRVANANLYQLASQYYGDWTLWETIANANGLTDFRVIGLREIIIPPQPTASNNTTTTK